jgi:hypothetical protein
VGLQSYNSTILKLALCGMAGCLCVACGCMIVMKLHMPMSQTKERAHVCTLFSSSLVLGWNSVACLATPPRLAARKARSAARVTPANMVLSAASGPQHVSTPPPHLVAARNITGAAARVAAAFMVLSARRINVYRAPLLLRTLLHLPLYSVYMRLCMTRSCLVTSVSDELCIRSHHQQGARTVGDSIWLRPDDSIKKVQGLKMKIHPEKNWSRAGVRERAPCQWRHCERD